MIQWNNALATWHQRRDHCLPQHRAHFARIHFSRKLTTKKCIHLHARSSSSYPPSGLLTKLYTRREGEGHCIEIPQIDFAQALIHNQSTSNIEPSCPLPTFATSLILAKYLMVLKSYQGNKQYVWRSLSTLKWHRDLDLGLQANIPMDCQAPGRHTKSSRILVR